jgi:spoIIIJ-associated protein
MTETIEFEGKNVERAIKCACDELGVDKETLKFKIISRGSTGIFGLVGTKKARISVRQPEKESSPKKDEIASGNGVKNETCDQNVDMETVADNGKAVIDRILESISPESSVSVGLKKSRIHYDINGGDAAILIGKRGQTLDAIQYVAEKSIDQKSEQRGRIQIDGEG